METNNKETTEETEVETQLTTDNIEETNKKDLDIKIPKNKLSKKLNEDNKKKTLKKIKDTTANFFIGNGEELNEEKYKQLVRKYLELYPDAIHPVGTTENDILEQILNTISKDIRHKETFNKNPELGIESYNIVKKKGPLHVSSLALMIKKETNSGDILSLTLPASGFEVTMRCPTNTEVYSTLILCVEQVSDEFTDISKDYYDLPASNLVKTVLEKILKNIIKTNIEGLEQINNANQLEELGGLISIADIPIILTGYVNSIIVGNIDYAVSCMNDVDTVDSDGKKTTTPCDEINIISDKIANTLLFKTDILDEGQLEKIKKVKTKYEVEQYQNKLIKDLDLDFDLNVSDNMKIRISNTIPSVVNYYRMVDELNTYMEDVLLADYKNDKHLNSNNEQYENVIKTVMDNFQETSSLINIIQFMKSADVVREEGMLKIKLESVVDKIKFIEEAITEEPLSEELKTNTRSIIDKIRLSANFMETNCSSCKVSIKEPINILVAFSRAVTYKALSAHLVKMSKIHI